MIARFLCSLFYLMLTELFCSKSGFVIASINRSSVAAHRTKTSPVLETSSGAYFATMFPSICLTPRSPISSTQQAELGLGWLLKCCSSTIALKAHELYIISNLIRIQTYLFSRPSRNNVIALPVLFGLLRFIGSPIICRFVFRRLHSH